MVDFNVVFLMAYIVFSEIRNYHERQKMLNRIMAKNLSEYVITEPEPKKAWVKDKHKEEKILV